VLTVGDTVYVAYAKKDADGVDVHGAGLGYIDKYTDFGQDVRRIASKGTLNAPWGMAIAPASFGKFAGDLMVGNFGDGHISLFKNSHFVDLLHAANGEVLWIEGLWGLQPGTASTGGVDSVWFSAGPDDEANGLVGLLTPVAD